MTLKDFDKIDTRRWGWYHFLNTFREQYNQQPSYLSFGPKDIVYVCYCYSMGWITNDFPDYNTNKGIFLIKKTAFNYKAIISYLI